MFDPIIDLVNRQGLPAVYHLLILSMPRPLGLMFGFIAFSWGMERMRTLRAGIAFAIGLPIFFLNVPAVETVIQTANSFQLVMLTVKELIIGYAIGLITSLPLLALQYAGAITDLFRGETDSGLNDPTGGTLATFSMLYLVIGFFAFFTLGGMWRLVETLYLSYDIWPSDTLMPSLSVDAGMVVLRLLQDTLLLAAQITIPLLALLVVVEMGLGVAARLGRRFNFYALAFLIKNMTAIFLLPLIVWFIWMISLSITREDSDTISILRLLFP